MHLPCIYPSTSACLYSSPPPARPPLACYPRFHRTSLPARCFPLFPLALTSKHTPPHLSRALLQLRRALLPISPLPFPPPPLLSLLPRLHTLLTIRLHPPPLAALSLSSLALRSAPTALSLSPLTTLSSILPFAAPLPQPLSPSSLIPLTSFLPAYHSSHSSLTFPLCNTFLFLRQWRKILAPTMFSVCDKVSFHRPIAANAGVLLALR